MSPAQIAASLANGALSTGPRTPEGKARSRDNAWRHGLTAQAACMPWEDRQAYDDFCDRTLAALAPEGDAETQLAREIADDRWRLNRIRAIESNILYSDLPETADATESALGQAAAFRDHAPAFGTLSLYESRISRKVSRNEAALKALRAERKAAYDKALEEAELLAELAMAKGEVYTPAPPATPGAGFVFSIDFLHQRLDRKRRLNEAIALFRQPRKRAA